MSDSHRQARDETGSLWRPPGTRGADDAAPPKPEPDTEPATADPPEQPVNVGESAPADQPDDPTAASDAKRLIRGVVGGPLEPVDEPETPGDAKTDGQMQPDGQTHPSRPPQVDDPPSTGAQAAPSALDLPDAKADDAAAQTEVSQTLGETAVRFVGVSKAFGPLRVLDDVSFEFRTGETTVIIGPSGTGKSVLLKHIVGLLRPDEGEVHVGDLRVDELTESQFVPIRRRIGFLFQMSALFDSMDVAENVTFPLREHTQMSPAQRMERCAQVLAIVGLEGTERKMPADLSGGQRKRVALARAIVLEPEIMLYDEPTTGLDPIRADLINELILSLSERLGMTSIVVTHDMASANKIADRMVMLYDGKIIASADPETFRRSDNDVVQRFIHGRADAEDLEHIRAGFDREASTP